MLGVCPCRRRLCAEQAFALPLMVAFFNAIYVTFCLFVNRYLLVFIQHLLSLSHYGVCVHKPPRALFLQTSKSRLQRDATAAQSHQEPRPVGLKNLVVNTGGTEVRLPTPTRQNHNGNIRAFNCFDGPRIVNLLLLKKKVRTAGS